MQALPNVATQVVATVFSQVLRSTLQPSIAVLQALSPADPQVQRTLRCAKAGHALTRYGGVKPGQGVPRPKGYEDTSVYDCDLCFRVALSFLDPMVCASFCRL